MYGFNQLSNIYFFTATILNWQYALADDNRKQFLVDTCKYLVRNNRMKIFGFVIMPNHIHILLQSLLEDERQMKMLIQGSLLKYTSRNLLLDMQEEEKQNYLVMAKDRRYQIWERNPLWVSCFHLQVAEQKLAYIHHNPCSGKWQLATSLEEYPYSSSGFYTSGVDSFGFLTNLYDI
jgi:putative transposase